MMASTTVSGFSLNFSLEHESYYFAEDKELISLAHFKAPIYEVDDKRTPINLTVIIDRSGSMAGEKLDMVKKSMQFLVTQFKNFDKLSIITFDDKIEVLMNNFLMNRENRDKAERIFSELKDGGSTALCGALLKGMNILKFGLDNSSIGEVHSIMMFTDGLANVGITKKDDIIKEVNKKLEELKGNTFSIHTFGYGSDHDSSLLKAIAEVSNGMYYHIIDAENIANSFSECLGGLMSTIAQNVTFTFTAINENFKLIKGLGLQFKQISNNQLEINVGDVYSEGEKNILVMGKVVSLNNPQAEPQPVLQCSVSFFDAIQNQLREITQIAHLSRPQEKVSNQCSNTKITIQRNRIIAADAMENARKVADSGNKQAAKEILKLAASQIQDSVVGNDPYCQSLVKDLKKSLEEMEYNYESVCRQKLKAKSHMHYKEQACNEDFYANSLQCQMKSDLKKNIKK